MTHIILVCAAGMSTSMLKNKMKASAAKQGLEVSIIAMAESNFELYEGPVDIILLGPQVNYILDAMKSTYEPKGIKVGCIDMIDYGMMNGEKVLNDALALLK